MAELIRINPESLGKASGYSNGVLAAGGRLLFIAGQIAWDTEHTIVGPGDFVTQFGQALRNVLTVVREAGGGPEHIAELTVYVTDKRPYLDNLVAVGKAYRDLCGKHFPAMAMVVVKGLVEDEAMVEIRGCAVIP